MLLGEAPIETLAGSTLELPAFLAEPLVFEDVTCFQLTAEMHKQAREAVLPASLHPTTPAALSVQAWRVGSSPFGAFTWLATRVSCRSGVRARGFTTACAASTQAAVDGLRSRLGFPARLADVTLRAGYDGADVSVVEAGVCTFAAAAIDPDPMGPNDVQYTGTLNLAQTPMGLRLIQVEAHHEPTKVDRLTARLTAFDAAAWGNALLDPYLVVSASVASEQITFPPMRFVCKVDETAFTGTEAIVS